MTDGRKYYVIDTNILIDYPDLIPRLDGTVVELDSPTVDLTGAHLVIPSVVIRELSNFKKEKSDRGKVARAVLKRLCTLLRTSEKVNRNGSSHTVYASSYHLNAAIRIEQRQQLLSVLPIAKDFVTSENLPFAPASNDMDGQIILAALAVASKLGNKDIDKGLEQVAILSNDNGLAIRAAIRGIFTSGYGYRYSEPYTGRREVVVPKDLLSYFMAAGRVELDDWREYMPHQPELVANEFVVMHPSEPLKDYDPDRDPYFSNIGRYDVKERAIVQLRHVREFPVTPKNPGQAIYAEALAEPSIAAIVCTGPAGSGKTYMATIYGYEACRRNEYIGVTVVPCEDHGNTGALPGDLDEKMDPDVRPLKNALRDYLIKTDRSIRKDMASIGKASKTRDVLDEGYEGYSVKNRLSSQIKLIWSNWFASIPIDKARGLTFSYEVAIYDEFQDQNAIQADTLIKRIGEDGKMILTGDVEQIHVPWLDQTNNGLIYASRLLKDNSMVAQVHFTEEEVVRHALVKEITKRQAAQKQQSRG